MRCGNQVEKKVEREEEEKRGEEEEASCVLPQFQDFAIK